ncbi:GL12287 [Drosophila persimilis]|uniref:alkaline phosphatase n=1 Tax=Drosophila persimilis TaxID=7234 RepID=B4H3D7_DROPE|nr:GL12287 [Drosophila persimilis]
MTLTLKFFVGLGLITLALGAAVPKRAPVDDEESMHPHLPRSARARTSSEEATQAYWHAASKQLLREKLSHVRNTNRAKNIILFLGDGMGLATLAAARSYIGGEEQKLSFEEFPFTGLSKVYSVDKIVPDSACTSTSYLCGGKANYGTIGVNGHVLRGDCQAMGQCQQSCVLPGQVGYGQRKGGRTGHHHSRDPCSPSGVYAHTADRE